MGGLHDDRHPAQQDDLVAPIELVGFPRREAQRDVGRRRPVMDIGIAGREGGQIGAGLVRAHIGCFERAAAAYRHTYDCEVATN